MLPERFVEIFVKFRIGFRRKAGNEHARVVVPALQASRRERGAFEVRREWRMVRRTGVRDRERFRIVGSVGIDGRARTWGRERIGVPRYADIVRFVAPDKCAAFGRRIGVAQGTLVGSCGSRCSRLGCG